MQNFSSEISHKETCTRFLPRVRKEIVFQGSQELILLKMMLKGLFHCVKGVLIRSFSGLYFLAFGLNTERCGVSLSYSVQIWKNTDQKNSEYGHFPRSVIFTEKFHYRCLAGSQIRFCTPCSYRVTSILLKCGTVALHKK